MIQHRRVSEDKETVEEQEGSKSEDGTGNNSLVEGVKERLRSLTEDKKRRNWYNPPK